jgi:fibronectin type 3 domain-containing protein
VDTEGNVLLGGITYSSDFPTTPGVVQEENLLDGDAFILKLSHDGTRLLFCTLIGTDGYDYIFTATADPDGNILTAGGSDNSGFPTTEGAFQREWGGNDDGFVMKLNHNCSKVIWCTLMGGAYDDALYYVEAMPDQTVMVAGTSGSPDYPVTDGCYQDENQGYFTPMVSILSSDGTTLVRSTYIGGSYYDYLEAFEVTYGNDPAVYLVSNTQSDDHPTSPGAFSSTRAGAEDIIISKLDINLTSLQYATYIGGKYNDNAYGVVVDGEGCAYIAGNTRSKDFPVSPDAMDGRFIGPTEAHAFLVKVTSDGTSLEHSTFIGGSGWASGRDLAIRDDGLLVLCMVTDMEGLPTTEHGLFDDLVMGHDIYLAVLDLANQTFRYGSYLGGSDEESYPFVIPGKGDELTLTAYTYSDDYPLSANAYDDALNDWSDLVVTRFQMTLSDPVPSDPPTDLEARLLGTDALLEWDLPDGTGDYDLWGTRVYRGATPDALELVAQQPPFAINWTDESIVLGETYYYAVSAYSPAGESMRSGAVRFAAVEAPGPPLDLTATPAEGAVVLGWTAPDFTGWLPLEGYHLLRGTSLGDMVHLLSLDQVEAYTDTAVETGQEYHYRLCAYNKELNSSYTPTVTAVPLGTPHAPAGVEATADQGKVTLRWSPPANTGGCSIETYRVLRGTSPDTLDDLRTLGQGVRSLVDEPLTNGVTYYYAVAATNAYGEGPLSEVVLATPLGLPSPPTDLVATPGDGEVHLAWEAPEDDGGLAIEGYSVLMGTSEAHMVSIAELTPDVNSFVERGLTNGKTYFLSVRAINAMGPGPRTMAVEATPVGPPGPPENLMAGGDLGTVSMAWLQPSDDGGSPVMKYVVYRGSSPEVLEPLADVSATFRTYWDDQVVSGVTYYYAVAAVSVVGEGPISAVSSAVPKGVPGAPLDLVARPGDSDVNLFWTPPGNDGALPITGYVVLRGDDPDTLVVIARLGVVTSYIDTSVTNGRQYHFSVMAVNALGEGDPAGPEAATPSRPPTVPGEVLSLVLDLRSGSVTLTWEPPTDDGGSPVTGYIVLRGLSEDALEEVEEVSPGSTSYVDTDVREGETYYYGVIAENDIGKGGVEAARPVTVPKDREDGPGPGALAALAALAIIATLVTRCRRR